MSQAILGEIKKLAGEMSSLRVDVQSGFANLNTRFDRLENAMKIIRDQTGSLTERVTRLEKDSDSPGA